MRILGYADGDYIGTCSICKKDFVGDKRATECKTCAIEKIVAEHKLLRKIAEIKDPEQHFEQIMAAIEELQKKVKELQAENKIMKEQ